MGVLTAIALGVMAVGTVASAQAQRKSAKQQRKAIEAQQRQADLANARERRSAIRNSRVMRASIESQAATTGLVGSSAAQGSTSNVQSRLGENLSFLDQNQQLSAQASIANQRAADYASKANSWTAFAGMGKMAFNGLGGFSGFKPAGAG